MKKNDLVSLSIEDFTSEGLGIGHAGSLAVFVKDAVIGDSLEVRLTKLKKNYAFARIERIIKRSPYRVEPLCPDAARCGGCQIQMMDYQAQLRFKESHVRSCLERIGGLEKGFIMDPIVSMEDPWRYRNKAQYPVGTDRDGKWISGFYAGRTHVIIPQKDCLIGNEADKQIRETILKWMEEYHVPAYHEEDGTGIVRHIMIRHATDGQTLVCLIVNTDIKEPASSPWKELVHALTSQSKTIRSVCVNRNRENTNVIFGGQTITLFGSGKIEDKIGSVSYLISPRSFYQVNSLQTRKLYETALEFAALSGTETVWDLYCGIGTISLFLAQKAKQVYGVEIVPEAIENARENAIRNGIKNAEFFVGSAQEVLPLKYEKEQIYADVIVVDPPRKGCDEAVLETMIRMEPKRIVYVSCDPATLARDIKYLTESGYHVEKVRPVDMFPHSVHVETVCLLSKLSEAKHHISVQVDMDELDVTAAESKATYEEIQEWVREKYGLRVSHLNIAKTKHKCGIIERQNYNLPKSEDSRSPETPREKEEAIIEAFRHFQMV